MTEYGKKIGNALRAVRTMHADVSRLFQDCDGGIGNGRPSIFGNTVTSGTSSSIQSACWMAEGVYRLYDAGDEQPGRAEGVTVHFVDEEDIPDEPVLIVGQIQYRMEHRGAIKEICHGWDLWTWFYKEQAAPPLREVVTPSTSDDERVEWVRLIAAPLFEIRSIECVTSLLERVRRR